MNKTAAFILTLFIDFCVLLAGSGLIVLLNVGGIIIMLIEFYFIKTIHKAVYSWLTGLGENSDNKETKHGISSAQIEEGDKHEGESCLQNISENVTVAEKVEMPSIATDKVLVKLEEKEQKTDEISVADLFEKSDKVLFTEEEASNLPYELDIDDLIHDKKSEASKCKEEKKETDGHEDKGDNSKKILIGMLVAAIIIVAISIGFKNCSSEKTSNPPDEVTDSTEIDFNGEVTRPASYENEVERWDAESCVYANFKNGVAFRLPNDIPWHKVSGVAKHTVVKFVQPNTEITLFVNLHEMTEQTKEIFGNDDIWDFYDVFTENIIPEALKMTSENSSEKILNYTFRKSEISGKHAIKTVYKSKLVDSRLDEEIMLVTIEYTFLYRQCEYTVALKCYEYVKDSLAEDGVDLEEFLQSFMLTPIDESL